MDEIKKMPFLAHLQELRERLIVCCVAVGIGFLLSFSFKERLFYILVRPLIAALPPGEKMIFTGLPEAFFVYLEIAIIAGIMLAMPVILYEMWLFIAPGLYTHERRLLLPIVLLSSAFFAAGALFAYFIVFPFAFKYLVGFETDLVRPLPAMREYLSLTSALLLAFGLIFELPLVLTMLARIGIVSEAFLKKNRKYAALIAFVAAALLTPTPDVFNQLLMAVPIVILYEVSIWGARVFGKKGDSNGEHPEPSEKSND